MPYVNACTQHWGQLFTQQFTMSLLALFLFKLDCLFFQIHWADSPACSLSPSVMSACDECSSLSLLCPNSEKNIYAQHQPAESSLLMEKSPRWEPESSGQWGGTHSKPSPLQRLKTSEASLQSCAGLCEQSHLQQRWSRFIRLAKTETWLSVWRHWVTEQTWLQSQRHMKQQPWGMKR